MPLYNQFKNRLNSYRFCILNKRNSFLLFWGLFQFSFPKMGCVGDGKRNTLWGWPLRYTGLYTEFVLESTFGNEISPASSSGASFSKPSRTGERETRVTGDDRLQEHSQVTTPKVSHAIWNPFLRNASFRRLLLQFHFPSNSLLHFGSITGVLAGSRRDLELHSRVSDLGGWAHFPEQRLVIEPMVGSPLPNVHQLCTRPWKEVSHLRDRPLSPFLAVEPLQTTTSSSLQRPFFLADSRYIHSSSTPLQRPPFYNGHLLLSPRWPSLRGSTVLPEKLYNTLWTSLFSKIS